MSFWLSSIVKWGYQDNLKPVYYFFYEKILSVQKAPKLKTNDFHPFRSFYARRKPLPLLFFVRLFLVCLFFLIGFGWFAFFSRSKSFLKKINWLEIVLIVSFTILLTRQVRIDPVNIYLFKVNNGRSTKKACKICLELTKTSEPSTEIWQWSQKWK